MEITLEINQKTHALSVEPGETLLKLLRQLGYFGAKHGCENGECGACTILIDGRPVNSCLVLGAQAEGHHIETIESIGEHPEQGWRENKGLHALQQAFAANGAIQCGYCTPGQILAAKHLLDVTVNPSEEQVRQVLSGVLCRCTGYIKPVQAVLHAAKQLREGREKSEGNVAAGVKINYPLDQLIEQSMPQVIPPDPPIVLQRVGKPHVKVDAISRGC
jgi:putative selenate reductase molybdopterin-binding subunit